ncbi:MAG: hypothetical protein C0481_07135 [Phenylobacterium sp.]|uniref:hypothetical protein n=1 Tax=Phenylobacterium sp. TaxID=1871053 RepID=UPI0025D197CB|nr:hypothetical protein [Phenylobacterium sp.]MBA4011625.1 hypothetical protein [Phenylobacterium sp.]
MAVVRSIAGAAAIYFCALFTALGVSRLVRDLVDLVGVEPVFGHIAGALIVAFALLPWAGFAVRTFAIPPSIPQRLAVGVGAVVMLFVLAALELTFFRRFLEAELNQPGDRTSAWITLALLLYAAILPAFRARRDPRD